MRKSPERPSATSLPASPHDEAHARSQRYLIMMGIRVVCFILMVVITPYGWYTWVLGAGAIFLPYVAVVFANVSSDVGGAEPEHPERALPEHPSAPAAAHATDVIQIRESPAVEPPRREGDDA